LCAREAPPERLLVDVVGEHQLAVDLDHREQLAVPSLQFRVAVDRHLLELEPELVAKGANLRERAFAKVTTEPVKDRDSRDRGHA
jgi:hypothetical protein